MLYVLKVCFAVGSWFLALGAVVIMIRAERSGEIGAMALIASVLIANGLLLVARKAEPKPKPTRRSSQVLGID